MIRFLKTKTEGIGQIVKGGEVLALYGTVKKLTDKNIIAGCCGQEDKWIIITEDERPSKFYASKKELMEGAHRIYGNV